MTVAVVAAALVAAVQRLTVYHVNPLHEGVIPLNMDTADLHGDMFFDLNSKTMPIECATPEHHGPGGDCTNQEVIDTDLVVTKLAVDVYGQFGAYGRCNVCNASDVDPFSRLPCHGQRYLCSCGSYERPRDCSGQIAVGAQNVTESFGQFSKYLCNWRTWVSAPWECWGVGVVKKVATPGTNMWYSHTAAGWCGEDNASNCSWSADVIKVVNKSCSDAKIYDAVEQYDLKRAGHFSRCPDSGPGARRNTSDPCWIYGFYATVLGAEALLPGGPLGGMPIEELDAAFEKPFKSTAQGGCPGITPPVPPVRGSAVAGPASGGGRRRSRFSFGVFAPPTHQMREGFRQAAEIARRASRLPL